MSERAAARKLPGEIGLWVFIFTDLFLFALYFVLVQTDALQAPAIFRTGRAGLSITMGVANTLVLLTGSWAVVMGTRVVSDAAKGARFLDLAVLGGIVFLLLKSMEWYWHLAAGHRIDENAFQTWYFFLTGFHALHVVAATVFLATLAARFRRRQACSEALVEAAGCYWHLVDLLWIGIFLVLYLI